MGIDFGLKRTGIAVTDPLQIIVQGLDTVDTGELDAFLEQYISKEPVDAIVVGYPFFEGNWGDKNFRLKLDELIDRLQKLHPAIPVVKQDERYSSATAKDIILRSGKTKKQRQDKRLLDKTSAVVILQEYLGHI
jgi:putative Holliday junction resolvase